MEPLKLMQNVLAFSSMPMTCPQCETELDQASGICPACRWDGSQVATPTNPSDDESYTDRYRGTAYHHQMTFQSAPSDGAARTRIALVVALIGIVGIMYFAAESLYLI
jgi:hypothetical protein